ncbi:membrane protein insertase YidC [Blastococcus brunescens]|uniref:Membrane protein insertase YidC n=1 Tax=Blastococcus brunescens TaxID=1564165 RepID=A0ABZ1B9W6_9ACTN|nr:membrane protein insertase YidC [Blastococcus sp. BMG 8361]WRL67232.1 membrane protein insertase YidC [Blastococcus sp. BMG 8361]
MAGCLPILPQIPVFLSLFHVLRRLAPDKQGLYSWSDELTDQAARAQLFGAPISSSFNMSGAKEAAILDIEGVTYTNIRIVAFVLIVIMCFTTYYTQKQIMRRSGPVEGQAAMVQKILLYVMPAGLFVSGFLFPIGVLLYWFTNNLWTLGQQFFILRKMPPPGSDAAKAKADADKPVIDPKTLAPKPGAKPVRPKSGRPVAPRPRPPLSTGPPTPPRRRTAGRRTAARRASSPAAPRRPGSHRPTGASASVADQPRASEIDALDHRVRPAARTDLGGNPVSAPQHPTDTVTADTAPSGTAPSGSAPSSTAAPGTVLTPAASGVGDPDLAVDDALSADAVVEPVADGAEEADEEDEDDEEDGDLLVREGDVAGDYLERLLDILDKDGDIDLDVEGDRASVAIVGGKLTDLIGPDGATLEALQELTRLAVAQSTGVRSRLMLDIGEFRARRRADLSALAGRPPAGSPPAVSRSGCHR